MQTVKVRLDIPKAQNFFHSFFQDLLLFLFNYPFNYCFNKPLGKYARFHHKKPSGNSDAFTSR